ncbi:MAG: PspA/IM30 family protein [Oscillospiraceae bacterium]|nr:PspA/IM30 family protein [Oscillospiraceae bacterium]
MGIFSKISNILKGYANSAVESLEDPKIVLEQLLRDLENVRKETTSAVADCMAESRRLKDLSDESKKQSEIWHSRAVNALKAGNEQDAKDALAQENKYQSQHQSLLKNFESQQEQVKILKSNLEEIETRISDAKRKKENIVAQDKVNKANEKVSKVLSNASKTNIYESLNRMEEKVQTSKRKIESLRELEKNDIESRFEKYDKESVDDDLEALKSEVFGQSSKKDGE